MSGIYKFGEYRLDCGRVELLRNDRRLKLERKPMDLLVLLISRPGQLVTRAEIAQQLWTEDVFVDTEHGTNTAVRKLRMLLRDDADEPRYIETVTGRGYRFVAPVTVEVTAAAVVEPEAPPSPAMVVPPPPDEIRTQKKSGDWKRWLTVVGSAAIVVAIVLFAWRRHQDSPAPAVTSLAVLPLENLSGDSGQEYFADGMTDELTTMLARNSTVGIRSRTSVMQYKRAHQPLSTIARALGVDAVVEGSVVRKDNSVHLNLQLIRAADDSHLWAQSYNRDARDMLLPEEAAQDIARQLHASRVSASAAPKINPAAHDAYLRGMYLWFGDNMEESGPWFRKATEIQPDYAEAWAGLANYYGQGVAAGILDPRTSLGPEEQAAERSLQLDPNLGASHLAMGGAYLIAKWDGANAYLETQKAVRLDPQSAELYYFRACVEQYLLRDDEAIASARRSEELAPTQRPGAVAGILIGARRYDAALDDLRLRLRGAPNNATLLFETADAWRRKGDYQRYAEFSEKALIEVGDPGSAASLRRAWQQGGKRALVTEQIRTTNKWAKVHYVSPQYMALLHAMLGEKDTTLNLLEEAYRQRSTDTLWIEQDPAYDFLHAEPRFRALVQYTRHPF